MKTKEAVGGNWNSSHVYKHWKRKELGDNGKSGSEKMMWKTGLVEVVGHAGFAVAGEDHTRTMMRVGVVEDGMDVYDWSVRCCMVRMGTYGGKLDTGRQRTWLESVGFWAA